ncbi:hypothetical protein ACWIID_17800 [Streptomyces phaeochromogenes]
MDAERAQRAKAFLAGGTDRLLSGLHPTVQWRAPVLQVSYPEDRDVHLQGRGLRLVPSYFCRGRPIALRDGSLSPVLVYPVNRGIDSLRPGGAVGRASAASAKVRPVATPGTHSRRTGRNPKYVQYEGFRPAHREHAPDAAPSRANLG